jgi:peroxiredoxin
MIPAGTRAPDFELKNQHGRIQSSADLRGKRILLSFHPLAWTGVCQRQMEALEMNVSTFEGLNALAFGISVDSAPCKKAWAESMNVKETALLADFWPHGGVAQALGLFREDAGTSQRANVIIDGDGIVRWIKVYPIGDVPALEEVLAFLRDLDS